jgi:ribosomal protein S18 acetylase RimI-like enzyme
MSAVLRDRWVSRRGWLDLVMEIRSARPGDVAPVGLVVRAAFSPYLERMDREPAPMLADHGALVAAGEVWVATDEDGEVVGVVTLRTEVGVAHLSSLAVTPQFAGIGLGTRLLEWAEGHARTAGCTEMRLYTNVAMTENLAWYPRRGYHETGRGTVDGYDRVQFTKPL